MSVSTNHIKTSFLLEMIYDTIYARISLIYEIFRVLECTARVENCWSEPF